MTGRFWTRSVIRYGSWTGQSCASLTAITLTGPLRRNVNGASKEFEYQQVPERKKEAGAGCRRLAEKKPENGKSQPKRMGSSEWMLYKGVAAFQQGHVQSNKSSVMSRLEHLDKKDRPDEPPQVSMRLPDAGRIRAKNAAAIRHLTVELRESHCTGRCEPGNRGRETDLYHRQ